LEADVPGIAYSELSNDEREAVIQAHLRSEHFKQEIIMPSHERSCRVSNSSVCLA
jgi:hypothetical protein